MNEQLRRRRPLRVRQQTKLDYSSFCQLIQQLRYRLPANERSLDKIAARSTFKRGQLYAFETISKRSRRVERRTIETLAALYGATEEEQRALIEAGGHDYVPSTVFEEAESSLRPLLEDSKFDATVKREFIEELRLFVKRWRISREARPRCAVILAAGWQAQIFREDRFQRSLFPSVNEAVMAGMAEVLIVVPPSKPRLRLVEQVFRPKGIRITLVFQERALGLGNALVSAKTHLAEEPFAVILPDDVDEAMVCLQRMVERYDKVRKPIIAVQPLADESPAITRNFGISVLSPSPLLTAEDRLFGIVGELMEKPSNPAMDACSHKIVGRYIFTPEIFASLTDHNLTTAINRAWVRSNGVCAYVVEQPLTSISRLKEIIVDMDAKEIFAHAYYH